MSMPVRAAHSKRGEAANSLRVAGVAALIAAPYGEELWRCATARKP